jgi:hypothetical protein
MLWDRPPSAVGDGDRERRPDGHRPASDAVAGRKRSHERCRRSGVASYVSGEPDAVAERFKLLRCAAGMLAAPAADMNAKFACDGGEAALERADDARGDAGGMPVPFPSPRRTTGTRTGVTAAGAAPRGRNDGRLPGIRWSRASLRNAPAMQRQIGASGPSRHPGSKEFQRFARKTSHREARREAYAHVDTGRIGQLRQRVSRPSG